MPHETTDKPTSTEPPSGAALRASRAVSVAEKEALLEAAGEPWPLYPDGTKQWWKRAHRAAGGAWAGWEYAQRERARRRVKNARLRLLPGVCSVGECGQPKHQNSTGTFREFCYGHGLEYFARRRATPGTAEYERHNPNGKHYGEKLRRQNDLRAEKTALRDQGKLEAMISGNH